MPGRILIADGVSTSRIALKSRLSAACYEVDLTETAQSFLSLLPRLLPDIVLVADTLPDITVPDLCAKIRGLPGGALVPIVAITDPSSRLDAFSAGADEVLNHLMNTQFLLARLRSLQRVREEVQELRLREETCHALGFAEEQSQFIRRSDIVLVTPCGFAGLPWLSQFQGTIDFSVQQHAPKDALRRIGEGNAPDLFIIPIDAETPQTALNLLPEIRSHPESRQSSILMVAPQNQPDIAVTALDLGANDVVSSIADPKEMRLRIATLIGHKRTTERLRATVRSGLHAAITDPLTGLFNRRYALPHLARITEQVRSSGRKFAVMVADLDHFKRINDTNGHAIGDVVLKEVAKRLRDNLRCADLIARIGGEEFLIVMSDTSEHETTRIATRVCRIMRTSPVAHTLSGQPVSVTISIGVAHFSAAGSSLEASDVLERADQALYGAKARGRNRVILTRTAA